MPSPTVLLLFLANKTQLFAGSPPHDQSIFERGARKKGIPPNFIKATVYGYTDDYAGAKTCQLVGLRDFALPKIDLDFS